MEKFSYSKLSTFEGCGWKYKLVYVDKHFIDDKNIAQEFGTLIHYIEETIARDIIKNDNEPIFMINIKKYIDMFYNINNEHAVGINTLKEKYPIDFKTPDKNGLTYKDKADSYVENGIFRLQHFLDKNRNINLVDVEVPFELTFKDEYVFKGVIDRVMIDKTTNQYIIEDIKTYSNPLGEKDLVTPLQFVFYALAAEILYKVDPNSVRCAYDLPLCNQRQNAGTKGFVTRGINKINKLLDKIALKDFEPTPSPLCHWCVFSKTNPNQPEEAKLLCPYYCNWTRENKDFSKDYEWMGLENHELIMEEFIKNETKPKDEIPKIELNNNKTNCISYNSSERRFMMRR